MAGTSGRYRLRYNPVRDVSRTVTVEVGATSVTDVIKTIRRAEGWIYILSLEEIPAPPRSEQTRLHLTP